MSRAAALLTASTLVLALSAPAQVGASAGGRQVQPRLAFLCSIVGSVNVAPGGGSPRGARSAVAAPAGSVSASDLRFAFGRLLGEHAYLTMEAMRAAAANRPDLSALIGGIDANTDELTAAMVGVYGPPAGVEFKRLWQQHIDALIAFAKAKAAGDPSAVDAANAAMADFRSAFSKFLAGANPHLSGDAEAHALQLHLDQLTSFVGMDYDQVFATERAAYAHMFEFGDSLAAAIAVQFPDRYAGAKVALSPRTTLRLDLGQLLGEHLVLAAEAMQAGLDARPDTEAAAASIGANAVDLAALIGRVYGPDAQSQFNELWGRHIDAYLRYIDGVRSGDAARRIAALDELKGYATTLAEFLHNAAPALSVQDLETLISHHVTALINQVDAAAAGDYERSVAVTREAYAHMFKVGDALGTAIADQFPDRFKDLKAAPATSTDYVVAATVPFRFAVPLIALWLATLVMVLRSPRRRLG